MKSPRVSRFKRQKNVTKYVCIYPESFAILPFYSLSCVGVFCLKKCSSENEKGYNYLFLCLLCKRVCNTSEPQTMDFDAAHRYNYPAQTEYNLS